MLFVASRLRARMSRPLFDVLELFAFVRPGMPFCPARLALRARCISRSRSTPEDIRAHLHLAVASVCWTTLHAFLPPMKGARAQDSVVMTQSRLALGPSVLKASASRNAWLAHRRAGSLARPDRMGR